MNNNQGSYNAQFKLDIPPSPSGLAKEHCRANRDQMEKICRHRGEQVRIEFPTANGTTSAIYTITTFHNDDSDLVFLGGKIKDQLQNCQLSNTDACEGEVKAQVTITGIDDNEAEERGEFIEYLSHDDRNHKLVVIAPHGGEIEQWTDKQAEYVRNYYFPSECVSLWICKGFSSKDEEDAFERWHITSTELSEKSFPKLYAIFGQKFEYSIAFHGWKQDSICVGGSADNDLKCEIKDAIKKALKAEGSDIDVKDSNCPEDFNGNNSNNIVNRLGIKGIQIEQSRKARDDFHDVIAQAVVNAISSRINV